MFTLYVIFLVIITNILESNLEQFIKEYPNFPKEGILYKDVLPLFSNPLAFQKVLEKMSNSKILTDADAIIAIDARGFVFGTGIAIIKSKPLILARKPGKLPGKTATKSYNLEYGSNSLSISKDSIIDFTKFAIVDDLLATGGTARCVADILMDNKKEITGLSVAIELEKLKGKEQFNFPVESQIKF